MSINVTTWAREHGTHYRATVALDNYEPFPRRVECIDCYRYSTDTVTDGFVIVGPAGWRDGTDAVYLMDDGESVRPYYVAGYHPDEDYVIAHPFPTTIAACDACGIEFENREEGCDSCYERKRRNGFRPIDFNTWSLGPRRAYHLKLRKV